MKFSYIIAHRSTCEFRHRNILAIINWLESYRDQIEIIVVEQDESPKIQDDLPSHVKYIFAYNPGIFHKTWAYNIGAKNSTSDNLIFGDNDVILNRNDFENFLGEASESEFCSPYRKFVVKLNDNETNELIKDFDNISIPKNKPIPTTNGIITGGLFSIKKGVYLKLGGEDENFRGWGAEDDAFREKLRRFNVQIKILHHIALHLFHPESGGSGQSDYIRVNYQNNCNILRKIKRMNIADLKIYIAGNQNIGDINKYNK